MGQEQAFGRAPPRARLSEPLRVGIINIMPRAETYEPHLLRPLLSSQIRVEPIWIRLQSHGYSSSDIEHVRRRYLTFDELLQRSPLDALILTGAPVEELPFEAVRYFGELRAILEHARSARVSTLGLCWGGLALGHLLGLPKVIFGKKLFGVFEQRRLDAGHGLMQGLDEHFRCAHSRHSGIAAAELERARAAGQVRLLAHGPETGYTMFESVDGLLLAHLGHPEYPAERLLQEWQRDSALGRADIEPPRHFDLTQPHASWQPHCDGLFANWLGRIQRSRPALASAGSARPHARAKVP
jgi:homoserine O-succinyltransferase/O-acetyltransferase